MTAGVSDRIEKQVTLAAPRGRVWRALTTPAEFAAWFGVTLAEGAFTPGARVRGAITHPGYEHVEFDIVVDTVEPERVFSWRWHPHAIEAGRDYSAEGTTLVTFTLDDAPGGGTRVTLVESGFDNVPAERRFTAYRGNDEGWAAQMRNIERHVGAQP